MSADRAPLASRAPALVQVLGFVRKELVDIVRQPRLLLVLVAGPFLIMLLFAAGYDQESVRLRTVFVGPPGSVYESAVDRYQDELEFYLETVAFTEDVIGAQQLLKDGDADLVVVFPAAPVESVLAGEQAVITVLHDKLDPLQQTAVEISAEIAVAELNATVLEQLLGEAQQELVPVAEGLDDSAALVEQLEALAGDPDGAEIAAVSAELRRSLGSIDTVTALSYQAIGQLEGEASPGQQAALGELRVTLSDLNGALDELDAATTDAEVEEAVRRASTASSRLGPQAEQVLALEPEIVVSPFAADTENLLRTPVGVNDFFTPSSLSLLLQHLAITFAAMALVKDANLGLFESFRVAPIGARHVLAGKYVAYLTIGGSVAAVLVSAVVLGLGIPLRGDPLWAAFAVGLLLLASIGLGFVLSAMARSSSQAIQYAMLTLLAGLFFGGFLVGLDAFRFPIRLVAWILPVTYGIRWLQDVMLRGSGPASVDVVGLLTLTAVYGAAAWALLSRRLSVR